MAWYNLFGLFGRRNLQDEFSSIQPDKYYPPTFYCANPQCRQPIEGDDMSYEPERKEVVHGGECQQLLICHRVLESARSGNIAPMFGKFDVISRPKAIKLARKGKISPSCLEKKV